MARSHRKNRQLVFTGDDMNALAPRFRGGKGHGLAVMKALGLPVPPFITISTSAGRAYLENGCLPKRLFEQLKGGIVYLEKEMGKSFGEFSVSVRSGAELSMAGMMDSFLGVSNEEDLYDAIHDTCESWNTDRAKSFRAANKVRNDLGTAITIQVLVKGDQNDRSATGVSLSHDVLTGERGFFGGYLINAQGPELVDGIRTPIQLSQLSSWNESIAKELEGYTSKLWDETHKAVETEWTVEDGKLWMLQFREAKLEPEAKVTIAVHGQWGNLWTHEEAIERLSDDDLDRLVGRKHFDPVALQRAIDEGRVIARGEPTGHGDVTGVVVTSSNESVSLAESGVPTVLARPDTNVDDFDGMHASVAIVTKVGGSVCHAALQGRAMGKAVITGCTTLPTNGERVSVSGSNGLIIRGYLPCTEETKAKHSKEVDLFLKWIERFKSEQHSIAFEAAHERINVNDILSEFYLLEAMMVESTSNRAYHREVAKYQKEFLEHICPQFACYVAIAVASEIRHVWAREWRHEIVNLMKLENLGLEEGRNRGDEYILGKLQSLTLEQQAEFFKLCRLVFDNTEVWGSVSYAGYGGQKWARIAEALEKYLDGSWTNAVFLDRIMNLEHNSGNIFNKHFMVRVDDVKLRRQLNLKHAWNGSIISFRAKLEFPSHVSTQLEYLWYKAHKLNLWKDDRYERTLSFDRSRTLGDLIQDQMNSN